MVGRGLLVCFIVLAAAFGFAQTEGPGSGKPGLPIPLQIFVPTGPVVFVGDGVSHLCYEIYFTNLSKDAWVLQSIEADDAAGASLLKVAGKELQATLRHPGRPDLKDEALQELAPGERVVAFMWVNLSGAAPKELQHKFGVKKASGDKFWEELAGKSAVASEIRVIASPLRGKNWLAANGPSNTSDHRRSVQTLDGTPYISQRYAIDWVQVNDKAATFQGNDKDNHGYYCFGVDALAVADATVVEVKDGIPENTPGGGPLAVEITMETVAGNHVNLDLGGGVFAMYAHLQPGSIRVKVGEKVTRGQLLGLVGNTGNSSEPHLHFQLMNRNSPLAAEGLPYRMDYTITGRVTGLDKEAKREPLAAPQTVRGEIPLENEVVDF